MLTVTAMQYMQLVIRDAYRKRCFFHPFFLQAINKGRKWLNSKIQKGVKYVYSYGTLKKCFDQYFRDISVLTTFYSLKIHYYLLEISQFWYQSWIGWIIDVMAAEIDKEGKLMNNKFRVNPSHLWRDFRHIFWSSSIGRAAQLEEVFK